jgi:Domain of unknown function (DUF4411)
MAIIWVIDTSSIVEVRRSVENARKAGVFVQMGALVQAERLLYPKQVVEELERAADSKNPDPQYIWAKNNEAKASQNGPSFEAVRDVLAEVPTVLDPDKDAGTDEADPYILALALRLRAEGKDARIVSEESKDSPRKMSIRTATGVLGIPSVPLKAFLSVEKIR